MINPGSQMAVTAAIAAVATGTEQEEQITRLGALRVAQLENNGFELGRVGRSMIGGCTAVADAVAPVTNLPTTTGPVVLYNANQAGGRLYHIKQVSMFYGSGTAGAYGAAPFVGVTPAILATPVTANATGFSVQAARGYGPTTAFFSTAATIAAGTAWFVLGSDVSGASTVTGPACTFDVRHLGLIVPPLYALTIGALGDTGTSAKYGFSVAWDELEGDFN